MKKSILLVIISFLTFTPVSYAAWEGSAVSGKITKVRTYQIGPTDIRAQITITGASHNCGTQPTVLYYDSNKIPRDIVKMVLGLALGALTTGKPVNFTWDCSLAGGGYGWGVALSVRE